MLYEAEHLVQWEGRPLAIFNPRGLPIAELPAIYGFNNGGSREWWDAVALAEDGTCLGGHACSSEGYMPHDLGMLEGARPDRHEQQYQKHYPGGYRMAWVPSVSIETHEGLQAAIAIAKAQAVKEPTDA